MDCSTLFEKSGRTYCVKMVEHVFKDCIISFKAICSSTLNKFCLERKSLNGRSTLLMGVVFLSTCSSTASLFAFFDSKKV